jgi:hypothetical protein
MAVGADQDALRHLCSELRQRLADAAVDVEGLPARIDVVEVEREHAAVVPADGAPASCFREQDPAHLLMPTRHRLGDALLAYPAELASTR